MKVIHIIDSLATGGSESMTVNLANAFVERNIDTFLCVTRKKGVLKKKLDSKVKYLYLDRNKTLDIKAFLRLRKYINNNNISVIHAHTTSSFIGFILKIITKKNVLIWHNHTGAYVNLKGYKLLTLKFISYFFEAIINVNKELNEWSRNTLNSKRSIFIPNFADLNATINKKTVLNGISGKRIVCVAGLRQEKDHKTLFKSFELFLKDNQDWTLHVIGKDYNNTYSEELYNIIKENSLENNVFFYGECQDIKNILNQSTIAVLSSVSEGLPVSLLEYGLAKLPVVCTNVGECGQVIKHNESGYLTNPKNQIELASYLSKLAKSKEDQVRFGKNLYINIETNYSENAVVKSILKIYKDCLQTLKI